MKRTTITEEFDSVGILTKRTTVIEDDPSLLDDFVEARRANRSPLSGAIKSAYQPMIEQSTRPMPTAPWWEDGFYHGTDGKVYPSQVHPAEGSDADVVDFQAVREQRLGLVPPNTD